MNTNTLIHPHTEQYEQYHRQYTNIINKQSDYVETKPVNEREAPLITKEYEEYENKDTTTCQLIR